MNHCRELDLGEPVRLAVAGEDGQVSEIYGRRLGNPNAPRKLLFLHGVGLTWVTWRQVLPALAEDADCLAIDLAGFGRSRASHRQAVLMSYQSRLLPQLLDALRWSKVTLVGHSMGGGVALGLAMLQPRRVASMVLIGSVAYPQPEPIGFIPLHLKGSEALLAALSRFGDWIGFAKVLSLGYGYDPPAAADMLRQMGRRSVAAAFADAVRDLQPAQYHRFASLFRTIEVPTLIIHGSRDDIVPSEIPTRLHEDLPHSDLVWVPCGHLPQESRPGDVVAAIRGFFAQQ